MGPVLILLLIAVLANLALMTAVVAPTLLGRPSPFAASNELDEPPSIQEVSGLIARGATDFLDDGVPSAAYDRVVRIATWVFILSTATLVVVTGLWPGTQLGILALLAVAGAFLLVVHELLPDRFLGSTKFIVEGSAAITFVSLLIMLTGGHASPFFFAYPVIVAGAALVVSPAITLVIAAAASLGYLLGSLADVSGGDLSATDVAGIGFNLIALVLLSYVAMVIAREQRRSRDAAVRLSTVDSLTGLFNRAFFFAALEREVQRSARSGRGFCLLMMDLDGLKAINDRHGHFQGDRVLRRVGEIIRAGVRRIDVAARYGGDEFVVVLVRTKGEGARGVAEKVRARVEAIGRALGYPTGLVTVSIGVAEFAPEGGEREDVLVAADRALYRAKAAGRNQVAMGDQ
ncbi:MAG: hypothetical protein DMD29_07290 [Gemmatimonadetes bacterium]|nr:MAG: hypothetical protein DMD29_07290 [Gemmatimonadota bacterium]